MTRRQGLNHVWADLIVEELIRCGIEYFVLAPGFRSAPLAMAVVANSRARHVMHYDERGSAFFALGYGRATGVPAAWITTSGTAAANGLPAVVEASTDGVPMLLLTADRPPELRHCGANQAIDQVGIFGNYPRWAFDMPAPSPSIDPAFVLTTVDQAAYRARRAPGGPVHLNCMFREPLATGDGDWAEYRSTLATWHSAESPYTTYSHADLGLSAEQTHTLSEALGAARRGLVVAGRLATAKEGHAVLRLAQRIGWPLLPDIASQLRLGNAPQDSQIVPLFDQLLGSDAFQAEHSADVVLHVGGRCVSKRLSQFLAKNRPDQYIVVQAAPDRLDPNHQVTLNIEAGIEGFCDSISGATAAAQSSYFYSWKAAGRKVDRAVSAYFARTSRLTEPSIARTITQNIPEGHALVLASSLPIREADQFGESGAGAPLVATNRGASGIDGTIAMAAGVAEGSQAPVTVVIGDLALLHDLNSLSLLRERPVVVVVINNNGGGVFHFLPVAEPARYFEPCFGTPHGLTFQHAADMFGIAYCHPTSLRSFAEACLDAWTRPTATLIEVTTNRQDNYAVHQELLRVAAEAIGSP